VGGTKKGHGKSAGKSAGKSSIHIYSSAILHSSAKLLKGKYWDDLRCTYPGWLVAAWLMTISTLGDESMFISTCVGTASRWEAWRKNLPQFPYHVLKLPIGSMYGIYANIGGILMVNVTIYSIHGSYGLWYAHVDVIHSMVSHVHWCSSMVPFIFCRRFHAEWIARKRAQTSPLLDVALAKWFMMIHAYWCPNPKSMISCQCSMSLKITMPW